MMMSTSIYYLPPLVAVLLVALVAPSQCLLMNPARRILIPSVLFRSSDNYGSLSCNQRRNSHTALHFSLFFDNFLHPYGVSPNNHTNNNYDDDDSNNNFLSLLLPKYRSPEELKSQSLEEFQRARLEQQLRVMRNEKQKMIQMIEETSSSKNDNHNSKNKNNEGFMADDDDMVQRMTDMFQNKRIEEQNKLRAQSSRKTREGQQLDQHHPQEVDDQPQQQQRQTRNAVQHHTNRDTKKHVLITNEAFQRALLEEQLRQGQQQQLQQQKQKQQDRFVIDMEAMEQDKNDILNLIESTARATSTDAMEKGSSSDGELINDDGSRNIDEETENVDGGSNHNVGATKSHGIISGGSNDSGPPVDKDKITTTNRDGEGGGDGNDDDGYNIMPINGNSDRESATKVATAPSDLSTQLKSLHRMVSLATAPVPPPPSTSTAMTLLVSKETTDTAAAAAASRSQTRIQRFLATTHLPLPPDETTPFASLALAPLAHIATSIFLSGAVIFYAMLAIVDILLNDRKEEYCTKTCMKKAVSIWKSCWNYLFAKQQVQQQQHQRGAMYRTIEATQTSLLALFYTCQCVIVRAATRSRYATECKDAGVASLRYLIYATRSLNFLWQRVVSLLRQRVGRIQSSSAVSTNTSRRNQRRKFHLIRVLSKIRSSASRRINQQRSLLIKQQRMRAEKEFQDKVQSLNEDILAVEMEKKQLDMDRAKLISEGVGVLAWYSLTKEASDALEAEREELEKERRRNGGKRHWRPRFGYWGLSSGDDNNSKADENEEVEIDTDNVTDDNDN